MIKIGDFAKMFDVSIKTVRFYEEKKLLKPALVDVYTGYRYFDEENVKQMSTILAYKSLGFELSEIKKVEDETILNKIREYQERIKLIRSQIKALDTLLNDKEGGINKMKTFINDENAIGKWSLIGLADTKEDFNNNKLLDETIGIKELYLMEKGEEYWVISWTKGTIYINGKPCSYEIIGNKMYVNLVGIYGDEEKVAVYEKQDDKYYTIEEITRKDDTNMPFVEDENLHGLWNSLGIMDYEEEFDVNSIRTETTIVKNLSVFPSGDANISYNNGYSRSTSYTKGYIKDFGSKNVLSAYEIKEVNGKTYLLVEWKSGDYVFGGFINCYYVFEKVNA